MFANRSLTSGSAIMVLGLLACPFSASAEEKTFDIDAVHSTAIFGVQHLVAGRFYGRFNGISGTIVHNEATDSGLQLDVSVAMDTIDTGNEGLDKHLRSPDFFSVEQYPAMTFKSTAAKRKNKTTYEVSGDLTLHGVTRPLTVTMEWHGTADKGRGLKCGFETSFVIKRSDFNVEGYLENGGLGDDTRVIVSLEANVSGGDRGERGDGERGGNRTLARFDTNKDGKLQKDEAPERMKDRFDELDKNKDGELDEDELRGMRRRNRGR